ncbi:MAG TPA: hypothetical protein VE263_12645 [Candidatus Angelobacter sp.]|nr:hypothetical protein [Candidatus Angelobacter sp.]
MTAKTLALFICLLLTTAIAKAQQPDAPAETPAFTDVPELTSAFRLLYSQKFPEARIAFADWKTQHPDEPFGSVAVAASFLFEELFYQGVLTTDFFLNEKRFLHGIDGAPDPQRMKSFDDALRDARALAAQRLAKDPKDAEALYALTLCSGMESNSDMILRKHNLDALKRLKEGNAHAKALLALRPDAYDAYVALGTANYIIGSLSVGFRAMLWFGGVHGDKKLGMEQVNKTVENGRYLKPFAKIMLALAARREKQNALAQKLFRELSEEFPEGSLYAAEYAKAMGRPIPAQIHP